MDPNRPWDDPSLRMTPPTKPKPKPRPKPRPKPTGISALDGAFGLEKRNQKIEKATRPIRKALPGQGL